MGLSHTEMIYLSDDDSVEILEQDPAKDNNNNSQPVNSQSQPSNIYARTLNEIQQTWFEGGKNFGSMSIDELISSLYSVEEIQADNIVAAIADSYQAIADMRARGFEAPPLVETNSKGKGIATQASLSVSSPMNRKTVEEVWADIQRDGAGSSAGAGGSHSGINNNNVDTENISREQTYGEMTLEEFLIKARVLRPRYLPAPSTIIPPSQPDPYGFYQTTSNPTLVPCPGFVNRPMMPMHVGNGSGVLGDHSMFSAGATSADMRYPPLQPRGPVGYGNMMGNGTGGYVQQPPPSVVVTPMSSGSSDGMRQMNNTFVGESSRQNTFVGESSRQRGNKRTLEIGDPIERVVERRQRRMIKNRESAARSRARKQAYTLELEGELNHLKNINNELKGEINEIETNRFKKRPKYRSKARRNRDTLKRLRRHNSCPV